MILNRNHVFLSYNKYEKSMEDIVLIYTVTLDPSESVVGKGINISLVLKKLGIESIATGIVNHKNVEQVAEELDKAEIENNLLNKNVELKSLLKISKSY